MEANYFIILYWFCHRSTWIHHGYTRVPNPEPPSHLPPHNIPLGHPSSPAPSILYHLILLDLVLVVIQHFFHLHKEGIWNDCYSSTLVNFRCKDMVTILSLCEKKAYRNGYIMLRHIISLYLWALLPFFFHYPKQWIIVFCVICFSLLTKSSCMMTSVFQDSLFCIMQIIYVKESNLCKGKGVLKLSKG